MRVAVISVHGCPLARLGEKDSGGMNVYLLQLARELGKRGIHTDVFTRHHHPREPRVVEMGDNTRVIHIEAGKLEETKDKIFPHLPQFLLNLRRYKEENGLEYDLIHSHYWLSGWVGLFLKRLWRIPLIASFHTLGEVKRRVRKGEEEPLTRIQTEARVMANADIIITSSAQDKEQMVRLYNMHPPRVRVIPEGVDAEFFKPIDKEAARQALGLDHTRILLYVGRIVPLKGVDILLRAAACLKEQDNLRLLVVGGDVENNGEMSKLESLADELGLKRIVSFTGAVKRDVLPLFYNAADVCVIPSYYESFGLVALEAMACATPVVAAKVGGLAETVRDGETGYLIPGHCPEHFAERLELLLGNENLRKYFASAARASAIRWRWSKVAMDVKTVYEEALQGAEGRVLGGRG